MKTPKPRKKQKYCELWIHSSIYSELVIAYPNGDIHFYYDDGQIGEWITDGRISADEMRQEPAWIFLGEIR